VEPAAHLLARLDRFERLEQDGAPPDAVLAELRDLVAAAEAWARREGGARARTAARELRRKAEGMS